MVQHPLHNQLRDAFLGDLAAAWTYSRHVHATVTPYAFVLYGQESPTQLRAHVLTEEGLTQSAQEYLKKGWADKPLEEVRHDLRWSVADAPQPKSQAEFFLPTVEKLFAPHAEELGEVRGYELLAAAATEALQTLDRQGLFGSRAARENLLLEILVEGTDVDFSDSAKRLNSPATYERLYTHWKVAGELATRDAIAVSRTGGSIYLAGRRTDPATSDERREIVAYAVRPGGQLARRWAHTYRAEGETVRDIAITPDGAWVYVLRHQMRKGKDRSTVLRFGRSSSDPVAEQDIPHRVTGLAVSHDGSRVVVASAKRKVHVLDASLSPVRERAIDVVPFGLRFLQSNQLLVASETKLMLLDPLADGPAITSAGVSCIRLSVDGAEGLVLTSPFPNIGISRDRERPQVLTVLKLPTLEVVRTMELAGHDLGKAVISPDGKLIACEAAVKGRYRGPVVVFDVASGREVARQKVDQVGDLAFLRDARTVAIAKNGMTTGEAIEFFTVA
jgi:DNA-binding beta-propeller fold protein YncE